MITKQQENEAKEEFIEKLHATISWAAEHKLDVNFVIAELWCALNGATLCKERHRDAVIAVLLGK